MSGLLAFEIENLSEFGIDPRNYRFFFMIWSATATSKSKGNFR